MSNKEKLSQYFDSLSEEEQLKYCKRQMTIVFSNFKKKEKALKREFDFSGSRTGKRGGRFTTLNANSQNATRMYFDSIEDLKTIINKLF